MLFAAVLFALGCSPGSEATGGESPLGDTGSPGGAAVDDETGRDSAVSDSAGNDSGPGDPVEDCLDLDTGIAVLALSGSWRVPGGSFEAADLGLAAYGICSEVYLCDLRVDYAAVRAGQENCPDCEWSFAVTPTPRATEGDYCDWLHSLSGGTTIFQDYSASEVWFGDGRLDGLGTNPAYVYVSADGSASYFLGQTFFAHYTYAAYDGWYFQAWNLPDYGYYQVQGDSDAATFARLVTVGGSRVYYYYY